MIIYKCIYVISDVYNEHTYRCNAYCDNLDDNSNNN